LLHKIAEKFNRIESTPYKKSVCRILDVLRDKINTIDYAGNTPLDILMKKLSDKNFIICFSKNDLLSMISLFKSYGAQTADELKIIEVG
jgi:hypothetical protein